MFKLEKKDGKEVIQVGNAKYQVMAEYACKNGWKRHIIGKKPSGKRAYEIWIGDRKVKVLNLGVNF